MLVANDKWWGAKPVTTRSRCGRAAPTSRTGSIEGSYDVVDIAAGSSGTLNLPDDYPRTDRLGRHRAAHLRAAGTDGRPAGAASPGAVHAARRHRPQRAGADRQRPAQPRRRGRVSAAESAVEAGQFSVANPDAARAAMNNQPLTVRIGYQSPNARLAATVGAIAQVLRRGRDHRQRRRRRLRRPIPCATTKSTC